MECRECGTPVPETATACRQCGAPQPAEFDWDGWGFEYRSPIRVLGLPLLHVSFKYGRNRGPVPACGIIAIGQFAVGVVTISQFGLGLFSLSQITVAGFAVAQVAVAYRMIAQVGLYLDSGTGQAVRKFSDAVADLIGG